MSMLLAWGPYMFESHRASYEELRHRAGGHWAEHRIIGRAPVGQYLGPEEEVISLRGTIFPLDAGGGASAMPRAMQESSKAGETYMLLSGAGEVFGIFRLKKAERNESEIVVDGKPLKVSYDLEFVAHADPEGSVWSLWP